MDIDLTKIHGNPTSLQHAIIRELEQHMGEDVVVVSPNNVASFMINMFSDITGRNIAHIVDALNEESPKRVMTQKQLYKHLSDYDYVDLFSTPASTYLSLNILLDQLSNQAPYVENSDVYRKLIIPRNTKFFIGGHTFSIYYPIHITYNTKNRMVVAWFDNETHKNPLYSLANDSLETLMFNMRGVDIVSSKFPVHQFDSEVFDETLMPSIPFSKTYNYKDKFYAVRIFTNKTYANQDVFVDRVPVGTDDLDGEYNTVYEEWSELHQTLDGQMYDPDTSSIPTVIVGLDAEFKQLSITIPFIFTNQNMLGDKLRVELYTTSGKIAIDGTQLRQSEVPIGVTLTGVPTVDKYSVLFTRDTDLSVSLIDPSISGGTDGLGFEQIRDRVVYNNFVDQLLVTPLDIESFFSDHGYRISRFKDGITRRIYTCHKELRDSTDAVIPSGELKTIIDYDHHRDAEDPDNKTSSIIMFNEGAAFMILPNSLFRYDKTLNITHPLTNKEREELFNGTVDEIISRFNNETYTFTPFHVMLTINNGVPISEAYDFLFPTISVTDFKNEIVDGNMPGMAIVDSDITYNEASEQFEVTVDVSISIDNPPVDYDPAIHVSPVLTTVDKYGVNKFAIGSFDSEVVSGSIYRYKFELGVTFNLDSEHINIIFGENRSSGILESGMIPFDPIFNIGLFSNHSDLTTDEYIDYPISGEVISDNATIISRYEMRTSICRKLNYLFNPVDVIYSDHVFETYPETVFAKYEDYTFETDDDGIIIINNANGLPVIVEGKSKGDYILSDTDNVQFLDENLEHHIGNDDLGIPADQVVSKEGDILYEISETNKPEDGEYVYMKHKVVEHFKGDPKIDFEDVTAKRDTKFRVSLTHINRRSSLYDEVVTSYSPYIDVHDYEQMIRLAIKKHADTVMTVKDRLLPNTEIYYTPFRSIGTALFRASSVLTQEHDLEIGISITLHVIRRVISDRATQENIRNRIIAILDDMLTNKVFSLTEVAEAIIADMSDLIISVDVNGINGIENIQTMMHIEDGTVLNLKHRIDIVEGRLKLNRDLNLRFLLAE